MGVEDYNLFLDFFHKKKQSTSGFNLSHKQRKKGLNQFIPQHKELFFLRNKKIRTKKINRIKRYTFKVLEHMYTKL